MAGMLEFDEDAARRVEAAYTTPDIVAQRQSVVRTLAPRPGESVLDLGVGPGFLAAEIAAEVGAAGRVCGVDISDDMLGIAGTRDPGPEAARLELAKGGAEQIPYDDGSFDAVVTTQVMEYVPDIPAALAEIRRVLKPRGRVLILDTDWDSLVWHNPDAEVMTRVLTAWEEHLADPFLPRTLQRRLTEAGFDAAPPTVLPLLNVGDPDNSFSGILLGLIANFLVGRHGFTRESADEWAAGMRGLGGDWFFSLNRYVFLATRSA
jgi:ubiquinone/menaquinone biosynthesis C-methylase UbiE